MYTFVYTCFKIDDKTLASFFVVTQFKAETLLKYDVI